MGQPKDGTLMRMQHPGGLNTMGSNDPHGSFADLRPFLDTPKSENGRRPKGPAMATPKPTERTGAQKRTPARGRLLRPVSRACPYRRSADSGLPRRPPP